MTTAAKFLVALLGAVLIVLDAVVEVWPDNQYIKPAIALITSVLVYLVPNKQPAAVPA